MPVNVGWKTLPVIFRRTDKFDSPPGLSILQDDEVDKEEEDKTDAAT